MLDDVIDDVSTEEQNQDVKDASSKSTESNETNHQQDGAAKSAESQKPQFDSEKFRKEAFKQASEWKQKYQGLEERFSKLEQSYTQKLESLLTPKQEASLSDQDKQALVQLFKMGMQVPEVAQMLGLDKTHKLESELQTERQSRLEREFDSELEGVVDSFVKNYGLKADEMRQELIEYISTNEVYGQKHYSKGLLKEAAKSLYFDRMAELQTRKANLDIIKEQQLKKQSNSESPSKGKAQKGGQVESKMSDFLSRRIKEEGGEISID